MTRSKLRSFLLAMAIAYISQMAGCSSFNRDWNALAETESSATGIEGRWEGTWLSDANAHHGGLRCIIASDENGIIQARYRATYAWLLRFEYTVPMTVQREGETWRFSGEADLGSLAGGHYEYNGTVQGDAFHSTYSSAGDHGTFEMTRVR